MFRFFVLSTSTDDSETVLGDPIMIAGSEIGLVPISGPDNI